MERMLLFTVLVSILALPAEAQFVTYGEKVPPSSGCYKPYTYDQGINLEVHVWSNLLKASDFQSLGVQPSEIPFEGFPGADASKVAQIVARDLSRLKDTGTVIANELPKGVNGKTLIHFYAGINLEPVRFNSGQTSGYVAVVHLEEICSVWGEGKDVGMGAREFEIPGVLALPTLDEMLRNLENLIYDHLIEVARARRQPSGPAKKPAA